ncbi:MAG: 2-dehydropantoate 2-reductase [Candidatus Tokpelaia hoelldobleri]|uniref:2-dehydropantoate 2-reductase n=1 Tax=Candidatus Tokpelaia hoelldobleri TaxID=1902579 RepID=A0A1U9JTE1_9HYPH|nr:MAG: 2-dehydropantoate 2-reductase [Candidatus Tokpelaia hoelldoblerii]
MKPPRILVLGAGGIGGYVGGRLCEAGADVTFLVRKARHALLQAEGLQVKSPAGDLALPVRTVLAAELKPDYDFILFTCKAYDLEAAITSVAPAVAKGAVLVPFLNGMAHLDRLNAVFGRDNVFGGTIMIQATLTPQGIVRHFNDKAIVMFGEQQGGMSERAGRLAQAFAGVKGCKVDAVPDALQRMWNKWVQLSVLAGMTCLMRANIGEIMRAHGGSAAIENFLSTNAAVAAHYGYPVPADAYEATRRFVMDEKSVATASMLRDLEQGGRIESEQILGDLLRRSEKAGIAHAVLSLAYTHVKAYEERMKAGRA